MLRRPSIALLVSASLTAVACSSSSDGGGGSSAGVTAAFSSYCTGTLSVDKPLEEAIDGGAWMSKPGLQASAGTTFLVSPAFKVWQGYVILGDGTPALIKADFTKGLVEGTDFTSSCASDAQLTAHDNPYVVLSRSTLYEKQDLSGAPCVLDQGTVLTNYAYINGNGAAQISAAEIQAKCGWSPAYSKDFHADNLVAK